MSPTPLPTDPARRRLWVWLPYAGLALGLPVVIGVVFGLGPLSLPGLAVLGVLGGAGLVSLLYAVPQALVVLPMVALPLRAVGIVFPYEIAFAVLAMAVWLRGVQQRASWLTRLEHVEVANLSFILWAAFTGFWCFSPHWYGHGLRRLIVGFAAFWVAYRVPRLVARPVFQLGVLLGAALITFAALGVRITSGFSSEQAALRRNSATDLGWGTANYVATLLLLMSPLLLDAAFRSRERWLRLPAWPVLGLITVLQGVIASRAAGLLFVGGTAIQVITHRTRQVFAVVAVMVGLAGFLASPLGQGILLRFTSLREISSMAVRVWYFRAAWRRTIDHFPWGMGLNQGWAYPDQLLYRDPHNYWLALSSELGVPGVLLWLLVLVLLWRRLQAMARTSASRDTARALMVAFWLSQIHTLVEPTFQGPHYQFVFFWLMGGYLGYSAVEREAATAAATGTPAAASSRR